MPISEFAPGNAVRRRPHVECVRSVVLTSNDDDFVFDASKYNEHELISTALRKFPYLLIAQIPCDASDSLQTFKCFRLW